MELQPGQVTQLLQAASAGSDEARNRLLTVTYEELRTLARRMLSGDRARFRVAPTELVNSAALKLFVQKDLSARDRAHFLSYAARVLRQVLIDQVRRERAVKRDAPRVTLYSQIADESGGEFDLEVLHEALERLASISTEHARLIELRYFSGLTVEEIAALDGVSPATVKRSWRAARAWLLNELQG